MTTAQKKLYSWRYPLAIALAAVSYMGCAQLEMLFGERGSLVLCLVAVTLSALNGGFASGLLTAGLSLLMTEISIADSYGRVPRGGAPSSVALILFSLGSVLISGLCAAMLKGRRLLEAGAEQVEAQNNRLAQEHTQRRQFESALGEVEARFIAFMDRSPAIAFIKDAQGRYIYVNKTWEDIYALDWRDKTDAEIWPRENVEMFSESDRRALDAGEASESFERVLDKEGRPQDWWVMKFPLVDGTGKRLLGGMALDVTARHRAERERVALLTAIEQQMDGLALLDSEGCYLYLNRAYAEIYGYSVDELIGKNWKMLYEPIEAEQLERNYFPMLFDAGHWRGESVGRKKNGAPFFQEISLSLVKCDPIHDRAARFVWACRDISAYKAADRRLQGIIDAAPGAVYQYRLTADGEQGFLALSDGIADLIGYPAAAVLEDFSLMWNAVIPEDREALMDSILESARTGKAWGFDGRVRSPGGTLKWLHGQSIPEPRSSDGSIVWNGILTDITERKQDELERARLAAIVETSGDAIISGDLDLKIVTWNRAAERLFGYTSAEVVGRSVDLLIPVDMMADVQRHREDLSRGVLVPPYDALRVAKNGDRIEVSVTQSPIYDVAGDLIGVSLSLRDIRDRKRAEKSLRLTQFSMDRAVDGIFWIKPSGEITYVNDAACRLLDYACEELIGKTVAHIDPNFPAEA